MKFVIFDMFETLVTHYRCPLYFSAEMAADLEIATQDFRKIWYASEDARTLGQMTFEDALTDIMKANGCYSEAMHQKVVEKRKATKVECFQHLHEEIIPMLSEFKKQGIGIGLITNCFSEEREVIRKSEVFPYFDVPILSCEVGKKKPDWEIYRLCVEALGAKPEECLYVGDGGSEELEAARAFGMHTLQAGWYLKEVREDWKKEGFAVAETPFDVLLAVKGEGNLI